MKDSTERVGLIAGDGVLPLEFVRTAKEKNFDVVGIGLTEDSSSSLNAVTDNSIFCPLGKPMKIVEHLKLNEVKEIAFAGKVDKRILFKSNGDLDEHAMKIFKNAGHLNDVNIMNHVIDFFESHGLKVISQLKFLSSLVAGEGSLNEIKINTNDISEFGYCYKITRQIAFLDIGQTVVFNNGVVIAVEAMEGTDATLYRSYELGGEGAIVCKVSRPEQDCRFDIPVVGFDTIEILKKISASALVVQAGGTLITDWREVLKVSRLAGIKIYGFPDRPIK